MNRLAYSPVLQCPLTGEPTNERSKTETPMPSVQIQVQWPRLFDQNTFLTIIKNGNVIIKVGLNSELIARLSTQFLFFFLFSFFLIDGRTIKDKGKVAVKPYFCAISHIFILKKN